MKMRGVINLSPSRLIPHPENPRKALGDLTEMTESVKKNGILQNLTAVPVDKDGKDTDTDHADKYMVIIGHRRLAAAKAAGIDTVPVRIVEGMSHEEQILTMLEENMQRSDLTIYDQAQSFQLMLDLGQTVEDIESKSGFSKTTIYHRLNIAKLDKDKLKAKQDDGSFQLSITDLIELEKIKDIAARNEILEKAKTSSELKYYANQKAKEEEKKEKFKIVIDFLEEKGLKKLPKEINSWNCDTIKNISINDFNPEDNEEIEKGENIYYYESWESVAVVKPKEKKKSSDPVQSEREKLHNEWYAMQDKVRDEGKKFIDRRKEVLKSIMLDELKAVNEEVAARALWQALISFGCEVDVDMMSTVYLTQTGFYGANGKAHGMDEEEKEEIERETENKVFEFSYNRQFAICLFDCYMRPPISGYNGTLDEDLVERYEILDKALSNYGFVPSEEDKELTNNDSKLSRELIEAKKKYDDC